MPYDHDQIDNLDAVIDGLDDPTTLEMWVSTDAYDAGMVAASAVRRSLGAGGGNAESAGQQRFSGQDVTVGANTRVALTWDNPSGEELLDTTSPSGPTIVEAGLYAFNLNVRGDSNLTIGVNYDVEFTVSSPSFDVNATSSPAITNEQAPDVAYSPVWFCDAGAVVQVQVLNNDDSDFDAFLNAYVQRIA